MRVLLSRAWSNDQHLPAVAGPWCSSWVIYCAFLLICDTIHVLLAFVSALSTSAGHRKPTASCSHLTMVRTIMLETVRNFLSTPALRLRGQPPGLQCLLSFQPLPVGFFCADAWCLVHKDNEKCKGAKVEVKVEGKVSP